MYDIHYSSNPSSVSCFLLALLGLDYNLFFFLNFLIFLFPPFALTIKIWPPQKVCLMMITDKDGLIIRRIAIFYKFDLS